MPIAAFRTGARALPLLSIALPLLCVYPGRNACAVEAASAALDEIVVTATRVAQPADQALEPIVIIERGALADSMAVDVGDLLRFHAGLDIGRSGGPGQPLSLFIRGANSDQSVVMIDGVRINSGTQSLAALMNLSPELFERVEIVKGPRSAIYGTDAIGGVVNFITRSGGSSGADAMLEYGRYGTGAVAVDGNYVSGGTSAEAALSGQRSTGFPTFAADSIDRGYKNLSGTAAVLTHVGDVELGARYFRASGNTQYANPIYNLDYTAFQGFTALDENFSNSLLAVHAAGDVTEHWHSRLTLSRVIDDLRQRQGDPYALPAAGDFDYTSRDTMDWQNDMQLTSGALDQLLTVGAIAYEEHTNSLSYGTAYAIDTHAQTYYLQDQLAFGRNRLLLATGVAHYPGFGNHQTWNAEYGYSLTGDTLLIASAGTAFRAPSATDRFGYGGSPTLKPEASRNVEVGVKSRLTAGQEVTLTAFQNTISDLIVFVYDPTNLLYFGENENVDRARIRGVEASWDLRAAPWSLHAEASLQDPRNLADNSPLLRRSRHSFTVSGAREFGRSQVGVDLLLSGPRPDVDVVTGSTVNDGSPVHDGGYLLAGLYGRVELIPGLTVAARLDNALNRRYELANGYNTAARSASIQVRYAMR